MIRRLILCWSLVLLSFSTMSQSYDRYVTDGCFLYKMKSGKLLMVWSSFAETGYAVGIAELTTGKLAGLWKQHPEPLMDENGGYGMLFRTFDGNLCLVLHQPDSPGGQERARLFEIENTGDTLHKESAVVLLSFCKYPTVHTCQFSMLINQIIP